MNEEQFRLLIAVLRQIAFALTTIPILLFVLAFVVAVK